MVEVLDLEIEISYSGDSDSDEECLADCFNATSDQLVTLGQIISKCKRMRLLNHPLEVQRYSQNIAAGLPSRNIDVRRC